MHRRTLDTRDIYIVMQTKGESFPVFDLHKGIGVGSFVTMCSPKLRGELE